MHLSTFSCFLVAISSAYTVLAESLPQRTPSPAVPADQYIHLEPRQGGPAVVPGATLAQGQVPAVTVYGLATQVGTTAVQSEYTYTQLFSPVPDQWPRARQGTIGYGNLQRRQVQAKPTQTVVGIVTQSVVVVMATEIVTQPLQKVTEVLVAQTMNVFSNRTVTNDTARARNDTRPAKVRGTGLRASGLRATRLRVAPTATD